MLIAIAGKAGSGKTTLSRILEKSGETVFHIDDLVNEFYRTPEGLCVVKRFYPECIKNDSVDKQELLERLVFNQIKTLFEDESHKITIQPRGQRMRFEDELYKILIQPRMIKTTTNIYFEGVLPRFLVNFDQVIYVERKTEQREKDLEKRGMNKATFEKIEYLQNLFPSIII